MIRYETGGVHFLINVCQVDGSVFPKALLFSLPSAFITALFVFFVYDMGWMTHFKEANEHVMNNNAIWGGFSFLVGFLVVFRTSQAYSRFWEGVTQTHKMGAEWFDACSSLVAFCKHSTEPEEHILRFQNILIRLFSMLHAAALGSIEDVENESNYAEVHAFNMELVDAEAIGEEALGAIRDSDAKVELIFQWVQQLVVENIRNGVLSIPPPILSRSFQEIAVGMVHFHEAMKISNVPFPFPYAQTCDTLLLLHWLAVPFIVSQWVTRPWWAGVFSFIQVFTLWTLNMIAVELENPFGKDPNDIDGEQMQLEFNNHLRLLLRAETKNTPTLVREETTEQDRLSEMVVMSALDARASSSFTQIWNSMKDRHSAAKRYTAIRKKGDRNSMKRHSLNTTESYVIGDIAASRNNRSTCDRPSAYRKDPDRSSTTSPDQMAEALVIDSADDKPLKIYGVQGTWEPCGDLADDPQGNLDVWEPDRDGYNEVRIPLERQESPPGSKGANERKSGSAPAGRHTANERNGSSYGASVRLDDLPKSLL